MELIGRVSGLDQRRAEERPGPHDLSRSAIPPLPPSFGHYMCARTSVMVTTSEQTAAAQMNAADAVRPALLSNPYLDGQPIQRRCNYKMQSFERSMAQAGFCTLISTRGSQVRLKRLVGE